MMSLFIRIRMKRAFEKYKKLVARSLDFVPIIGPFLMMIGYIRGYDLISKVHFKRVSRRWFGFLGSAIFTLIVNVFVFGEILHMAWYIVFPFDFRETALIVVLVAITWYICHAIFLGIDLFTGLEDWLVERVGWIRKLKEKQDEKE